MERGRVNTQVHLIMIFRKALEKDIDQMAKLISDLLGSCELKSLTTAEYSEINSKNIETIKKDYSKYYVCELNNKIVGICGVSDIIKENDYGIKNLKFYREILYLVVDTKNQKQGIGTKLLTLCTENIKEPILYEAWGDGNYVNSKFLLEKCGFKMVKNLGDSYYKENGYCYSCCNRNKDCTSCKAEVWVKE